MKLLIIAFAIVSINTFAKFEESYIEDRSTGERIVANCLTPNNFTGQCNEVGFFLVGVSGEKEVVGSVLLSSIMIEPCNISKVKGCHRETKKNEIKEIKGFLGKTKKNNFYNGFPKVNHPKMTLIGLVDYTVDDGTPGLVRAFGHTVTTGLKIFVEFPVQVVTYLISGTIELGVSATAATTRLIQNRKISKALKAMVFNGKKKQVRIRGNSFRRLLNSISTEVPTI